jgi:hypothetical protein
MANYPPPPPPPPPGPPYGPPYGNDWRYQRRAMKDQARAQRDLFRAQRDAYRYQTRGLRRGSILGPLIVIAVGIIFLLIQTGKLQGRQVWIWYAHYWPVLFVVAGIVLLLEWVFDQFTQSDPAQPIYRRRIGGGVVALLLLLGITGFLFSGFREGHPTFFGRGIGIDQNNLYEFLGDKHESDQTLSQAFPAGASLSLDNPRGDVTVSGTSDDNQIHITVHKEVYSRSDADADAKAQQLSPQLSTSGNTVTVSVPSIPGALAGISVILPPSAATSITVNHGDVHVNSIKAAVSVTANHGDIDLSAITGPVTTHINNSDASFSAHSITGSLTLEGHVRDMTLSDLSGPVTLNGEFFGTTHLERIRGPIKFHTSRTDFQLARLDGEVDISNGDLSTTQAVGPLTLSSRNRNITLDRITGDVSVTNRNGSIDLTSAPPLGNVTIENRNGSVNVTVPEHSSFTVQAETTNGDLDNDFSLQTQGTDTHKTFNGTVGKGGPLLRITTSQADVSLKKANVLPLPPTPPDPPKLTVLPPGVRESGG